MKRLSIGVLAVLMTASLGLNALAAPTQSAPHGNLGINAVADASDMSAAPAANLGSPPSGQIPILYNDHHVYAKPDELKQGRVLAALVRGGTVLIPLRSMFEQMGGTVSYNASSKTVDVSKAGTDIKVTVGKPEVWINGESRPLDVPPELYMGHVVVPLRVISEGLGAYVQWVPDQHVVVVRYVVPTAPPSPPPAMSPVPVATVAPTAAPTAAPTPYKDRFVAGDYIISPKVYNEFSPGNTGTNNNGFSYQLKGVYEFNAAKLPLMIEGNYRQINYPHNQTAASAATPGVGDPAFVNNIGGVGNSFVPAFQVRDYDFDGRLAIRVANPHVYLGVGYLSRSGNYGYPRLKTWGVGAEKLPDLNQVFSIYGSLWYYPNAKGNFTAPSNNQYTLAYNEVKYEIGGTYSFGPKQPLFIDFGFLGDRGQNKTNAPSNFSHAGPYVGLGLKF